MFNVDEWLDRVIQPEFSEEVPVCDDTIADSDPCFNPPDPYRHISSRDWSGTLRVLVLCIGAQAAVSALAVLWDFTHYWVWRLRKKGKLIEASEKYTYLSMIFDTMDVGMSIACCITFVLRAYTSFEDATYAAHRQQALDYIDYIASGLFGIRFIDGWMRTNSRMAYTLRLQALLDVFTITSAIAVPLLRESWLPFTFLRPISMTQALSRLMRITDLPELYEQLALTLAEFFSMVFTFAGIIFLLENLGNPPGWADGEDQNFSFMSAVWFVTVTVSTVGYGDFSPTSILGRVAGVVFIVIGVIFFGSKTSAIASLMAAAANGLGRYSSGRKPHVLLTGHLHAESLNDFAVEFFHREHAGHSKADYPVCILAKKLINLEPLRLTQSIPYHRLQQLMGSVLKPPDLERCKIHSARACFLLGDALAHNAEVHDREILLRALAVKRVNPKIDIFLQVQRAASLPLAVDMTAVSMTTIKCGLLAKTAVCPGVIPLVGNLLRSIDSKSVRKYKRKKALGIQPEYLKGMESEIYRCTLPESLRGKTFGELVHEVYTHRGKGLLLFALSVDRLPGANNSSVGSARDLFIPSPNIRSVAAQKPELGDARMVMLHPGKDYVVYEPYCMVIAADDPQNALNRIGGVGLGHIVKIGNMHKRSSLTSAPSAAGNQVVPTNGEGFGFGIPPSPVVVNDFVSVQSEEDQEEEEVEQEDASTVVSGWHFGTDGVELAGQDAAGVRMPGALGLVTHHDLCMPGDTPVHASTGNGDGMEGERYLSESGDGAIKRMGAVKPLPPVVEGKKKRRKVKKDGTPNKKAEEASDQVQPGKTVRADAAQTDDLPPPTPELNEGVRTPSFAMQGQERQDLLQRLVPPLNQLNRSVDLENHIVVCGFPSNVGEFLRPIRSAARSQPLRILFVNDVDPSNEQLRQMFPAHRPQHGAWNSFQVLLLHAPPLHPTSMKRANVGKAGRVLLLAEAGHSSEAEDPGLMDAAVIFAHRFVAQEYPATAARIASELRWDESVGFLDDAIRDEGAVAPLYLQPSFAEGSVYSAAMSTSMLAQAYYNPHLLSIVGKLLSSRITNDASDDTSRDDVQREHSARSPEVEMEQVDVSVSLEGRTYSELLRFYVQEQDMVPLGLYRHDHTTKRRYTFTNPPPDTKVRADDKVFVLARRQPL